MDLPPLTRATVDKVNLNLSLSHKAWLKSHGRRVRPKLTKFQLEQLKECFGLMDADGSGAVDASELGAALKLLGIKLRKDEVNALVAEVDPLKTGEVDLTGFLYIMTTTMEKLSEQENAAPSVPFSLVSTAYRRKRMMEGLLTGDKEVKSQLCAMQDKREHESNLHQTSSQSYNDGEASTSSAFHPHDVKKGLKASVFGKHRLEKISHMNIDENAVASLAPDEQWAVMEALQHSLQMESPSPSPSPTRLQLQPLDSSTSYASQLPASISPKPRNLKGYKEPPLIINLKFEKSHLVRLPGYAMDKSRDQESPSRSPSSLGQAPHKSSPPSKLHQSPDQAKKIMEERLKITAIR